MQLYDMSRDLGVAPSNKVAKMQLRLHPCGSRSCLLAASFLGRSTQVHANVPYGPDLISTDHQAPPTIIKQDQRRVANAV